MMIFLFIQVRKMKHSIRYRFFYNAEEMKKGRFIAVISKYRWYKPASFFLNIKKVTYALVFIKCNFHDVLLLFKG